MATAFMDSAIAMTYTKEDAEAHSKVSAMMVSSVKAKLAALNALLRARTNANARVFYAARLSRCSDPRHTARAVRVARPGRPSLVLSLVFVRV